MYLLWVVFIVTTWTAIGRDDLRFLIHSSVVLLRVIWLVISVRWQQSGVNNNEQKQKKRTRRRTRRSKRRRRVERPLDWISYQMRWYESCRPQSRPLEQDSAAICRLIANQWRPCRLLQQPTALPRRRFYRQFVVGIGLDLLDFSTSQRVSAPIAVTRLVFFFNSFIHFFLSFNLIIRDVFSLMWLTTAPPFFFIWFFIITVFVFSLFLLSGGRDLSPLAVVEGSDAGSELIGKTVRKMRHFRDV